MAQIEWQTVKEYEEITFKQHGGVARIAFNRPEVRNAFTPKTVDELWEALILCHESQEIGVVLITGEIDLVASEVIGTQKNIPTFSSFYWNKFPGSVLLLSPQEISSIFC